MALYWCSLIVLAWIGARDWRQRRITNSSLLVLAIPALVYAGFWGGLTWQQVGLNLLIGLALTLPGYIRGAVGGGDVKLMAAVAPLWPPLTLLIVFAAGTAAAVLMLQLSRYLKQHSSRAATKADTVQLAGTSYNHTPACTQTPNEAITSGLPLGSAIALGAILVHAGTTMYSSFSSLT